MNLDSLLHPLSWRDFELGYYRKQPLVLSESSERFAHLVTRGRLFEVLNSHRFTSRRLSFVRAGVRATRESYLWNLAHEEASLVRTDAVESLMSAGYHLVLNGVDEFWTDVRDIAEAWEAVVGTHVPVNLYAVWNGGQGFRLHSDTHDTVLLQVSGHKQWTVYSRPSTSVGSDAELGPLYLSTKLSPGAVLYIPQGWPHKGEALSGHSAHLTLGLAPDPVSIFLRWCAHEWRRRPWASDPIPWPVDAEGIEAFMGELTDKLRQEMTYDLYKRFRFWKDTHTLLRPRVSGDNLSTDTTFTNRTRVRWLSFAYVHPTPDTGGSALIMDGRSTSLPSALVSAVSYIRTWPPVTWQELTERVEAPDSTFLLKSWLIAMALGGHIAIENDVSATAANTLVRHSTSPAAR